MAFDRASKEEQTSVAPLLLNNLPTRPEKHQAILLRLAVRLITSSSSPSLTLTLCCSIQIPRILAQYRQRELNREKLVIPTFFANKEVRMLVMGYLLDALLMVPIRMDDAR